MIFVQQVKATRVNGTWQHHKLLIAVEVKTPSLAVATQTAFLPSIPKRYQQALMRKIH